MGIEKYLDGNLVEFLKQAIRISNLSDNEAINRDILPRIYPTAKIILISREKGLNWLWSEKDIEYEEEYGEYKLPSVNIDWALGCEGHDNVKLNLETVHNVDTKGYIWDTEYSAWYPKFKTKVAALNCIESINKILDKRYLNQLESLDFYQ